MNDPQEEARQDWLCIELSERAEMAKKLGITMDEVEQAVIKLAEAGKKGEAAGKKMRTIQKALINAGLEPTESNIRLGIRAMEEEE